MEKPEDIMCGYCGNRPNECLDCFKSPMVQKGPGHVGHYKNWKTKEEGE